MIDLINFLPNWVLWALLVGSVALAFVRLLFSMLPWLAAYENLLKLVSAVMLAFSLFGMGVQADRADVELEVAQLKLKVAEAEKESANATTEIIFQYKDRIKVIEGKERERIVYVDKYITPEDDRACVIPDSFRLLHDAAANNTVPQSPRRNDPATGPKPASSPTGPKAE